MSYRERGDQVKQGRWRDKGHFVNGIHNQGQPRPASNDRIRIAPENQVDELGFQTVRKHRDQPSTGNRRGNRRGPRRELFDPRAGSLPLQSEDGTGFVPDPGFTLDFHEGESLDKNAVFTPDTREDSEASSWARVRAALLNKSKCSTVAALSHLDDLNEITDLKIELSPEEFNPKDHATIPDLSLQLDLLQLPELDWRVKTTSYYNTAYWTLYYHFPNIPRERSARKRKLQSMPKGEDVYITLQHGTNKLTTEEAAKDDHKKSILALEKKHVHLDPPEMAFFNMSSRSNSEIAKLMNPRSGDNYVPLNKREDVQTVSRLTDLVRLQNESAMKVYILPLYVPMLGQHSISVGRGEHKFPTLSDGLDVVWGGYTSLGSLDFESKVQPSYTVGFDRLAFPPASLAKLALLEKNYPNLGCCTKDPDQAILFPFFTVDICATWPWPGLKRADARSAHTMAHAGRALYELYKLAGLEARQRLNGTVSGFSVQLGCTTTGTDEGQVLAQVCAHYPVIMGPEPDWCRTRLKKFTYRAGSGGSHAKMSAEQQQKQRMDIYRFALAVYVEWAPQALRKIIALLDEIEVDNEGKVKSSLEE